MLEIRQQLCINLFKGLEHDNFDVLTCSREHAKIDNRKLKNKVYNFAPSKSVSIKLIWRFHYSNIQQIQMR